MRRKVVATAVVLAVVTVVFPAAPALADPPVDHADLELQLIDLVNAERVANDLDPLEVYWDLTDDARIHTQTMVDLNWLHHNPDLTTVTTGWWRLGENVGYAPTAAILHGAWMDSPGHRANILGDFNYIGIGVEIADNGLVWGTQVFMKGAAGINVPPSSPARSISGTVTAEGSGAPRAGITVTAYARDDSVAGTAVTNGSGIYTITGLDPDYYRVGAAGVFYPAAGSLGGADPISAVLGADGVDVDLVVAGNEPPVATSGTAETVGGYPVPVHLDADDPDGDPLTLTPDVTGLAGTLTGSGADLVFDPTPGFSGETSFTFTAFDGEETSPPATVTITVVDPAEATDWDHAVSGDFSGDGRADVAMYDAETGVWEVGVSTGTTVAFSDWTDLSITNWDSVLVGDFDGDGHDDLAMYVNSTGKWWVATSTGSGFTTSAWSTFSPSISITSQFVGDFDGDGRDDLANFEVSTGKWWVSLSVPGDDRFATASWARFTPSLELTSQLVGDFDGDGRDDLANYHQASGRWFISRSTGSGFATAAWAQFTPGTGFFSQFAGDFDGDGDDDLANYDNATGHWWVSLSDGVGAFATASWSRFTPSISISDQFIGDFDGDGRDDLANFEVTTGKWWISLARPDIGRFATSTWSQFTPSLELSPQLIADLDGNGRDDLANYLPASRRWFGSLSTASSFGTYILGQAPV